MRLSSFTHICVVALALAGPGCRTGYEIMDLEPSATVTGGSVGLGGDVGDGDFGGDGDGDDPPGDGDGDEMPGGAPGTGGSSSGGAPAGGSDTGGAASGGTGTGEASPDTTPFVVESTGDVGGDPTMTTLREAIAAVILAGGGETITFAPGLTISLESPLPAISETLTIEGNNTTLDFSGLPGGSDCITSSITNHTLTLDGLTVSNCPGRPLYLSGGLNHVVTGTNFEGNGGPVTVGLLALGVTIGPGDLFNDSSADALRVNAPGTKVLGNLFFEPTPNSATAIFLDGGSSGSQIIGNTIVRAGNGIKTTSTSAFLSIWHNTIVQSAMNGIQADVGGSIDIRNNVITNSAASGIVGDTAQITALDYNLYFANGAHCTGCSGGLGAHAKIVDPMYLNAADDNFDLKNGSQAIDAGDPGVAVDRNGGAAGDFFGAAPDIGAVETNY